MSLIVDLLRNPHALIDQHDDPRAVAHITPRLLGIIALGTAIFGAVPGSWRGGIQTLYAALKMPAVFLIPLLVGLPLVAAVAHVSGLDARWTRVSLAGLVATARTAVFAAALGPFYWLLQGSLSSYHEAVVLLAVVLAAVGAPGLWTLATLAPTGPKQAVLAMAVVVALGLPMAQGGWLLRPFVARPTAEVALFRPVESNIADALVVSLQSSNQQYGTWHAKRAGLLSKKE